MSHPDAQTSADRASTSDKAKDFKYKIGRLKITLPQEHKLPLYKRTCPQYDRFLPHLAHYLPQKSCVIDVGANCADTLAGMLDKNPSLGFLCIEADEFFYQYLIKNTAEIKKTLPDCQVKTVQCLAGAELNDVILIGQKGTRKAVAADAENKRGLQSKPLDHIIQENALHNEAVSLLKVDTDGHDYDVINSAPSLLTEKSPILFFECQYENENQKAKYEQLIGTLRSNGYANWAAFDNYGALLIRQASAAQLADLIEYVWRQNTGQSRRTFFYFDLMAWVDRDSALVQQVLESY